jgi:ribosome-associated translation inhibitor RaiA
MVTAGAHGLVRQGDALAGARGRHIASALCACGVQTASSSGPRLGWRIMGGDMQIQFNSDRNIEGDEAMARFVESVVQGALDRFSEQVTRVEVHVRDENSNKKGGSDDIRCLMEARLGGRQPVAVSHNAATVEEAVDGAAGKLQRSLESTLGRLSQR